MKKQFNKIKYDIPSEYEERFDFLTIKIEFAKLENHIELYRGLLVVFNAEFGKYESRHSFWDLFRDYINSIDNNDVW